MPGFIERQTLIRPVQALGQVQAKYMFQVWIPYIPAVGPAPEITLQARGTTVPEVKRDKTIIYTALGPHTIPHKKVFAHEWAITFMLTEIDLLFRKIWSWFELLDVMPLESLKTKAIINLMSTNVYTPTKMFILNGLYPLSVPAINDLTYDESSGLITFDTTLAFDDIQYL